MKQKIVIKVQMRCRKCRVKVLKIVAETKGDIESYQFDGDERDYVVVIGERIDVVSMVNVLRKKVGQTDLVSLGEAEDEEQ